VDKFVDLYGGGFGEDNGGFWCWGFLEFGREGLGGGLLVEPLTDVLRVGEPLRDFRGDPRICSPPDCIRGGLVA